MRNVLITGTLVFLFPGALVLAGAEEPKPAAEKRSADKADHPFRIFDGRPKQVVLVTNSHGGQRELGARLKKMPGGEKIEFRSIFGASFNGRPGGTPPNWVPGERVTADMPTIYVVYNAVDANVQGKRPLPDKPREQWSASDLEQFLQGYIGPEKMSEEEIEMSLKYLRHEVQCATEKGINLLVLSNTHYCRTGRGGPAGADGSDEAVRRWNQTDLGRRHPAVDVRTPTRAAYPLDVCADRFHPSDAGREINAHCWFAALCAWDGVEVPAFSKQMMDDAVAKEKANRDAIRDIAVTPAGPHRPGDTVTITWKCDPKVVQRVKIHFSPGPGMWAAAPITDSAPVAGPEGGSFAWKIPASITGIGKNKAEFSVPTVSNLCFLRVANAVGPQWRTTESPFQIMAPLEKR
jgi:hypothetical protein